MAAARPGCAACARARSRSPRSARRRCARAAELRLTTERLICEPLRVEHADEMVSVLSDPALYVHIGGTPPSLEELRARYARQVRGPGWLNWMLRLRDGERLVGFVQATVVDGTADLAWLVAPAEQGEGLATEGATAVAEWLRTIGVATLTAHIHPDNVGSEAIARRLGMSATGVRDDGETRWSA